MRALAGAALAWALMSASVSVSSSITLCEDDYPLVVGRRWVYRGLAGFSVVREVGEVREGYFLMKYRLPIGTYTIPMRRTREGVVTHREGREVVLLRFPMRPGDWWRIDLPGEAEIADCEVVGLEEVEFLGRRRFATRLRVTRTDRATGKRRVDSEWYARGVGLVRMEVTVGIRVTFVLERVEGVEDPEGDRGRRQNPNPNTRGR